MCWTRFVSPAVLCAVASAQGPGGPPVTASDLVRQAVEGNREVLALRERINEARGLLRQAGVRPTPFIEVSGASGRPLATPGEQQFSAAYTFTLEAPVKRERRIQAAERAIAVAEAEVAERERQLAADIQARAVEVLAERQRQEAAQQLVAATTESLRLVELRVREGDAAPLDASLLRVDRQRAQAQRATAVGRAAAALAELARLVGAPLPEGAGLTDAAPLTLSDPSLPALQQRALEIRPDLRTARLAEQQGAAEVALAEAQARPDLIVSAGYTRETGQFDDQFGFSPTGGRVPLQDRDNILSVGVSIPFANRRRNQGYIEAAAARVAGARLRREHLERTVPLEVEAAHLRWSAAKDALAALDQGVVEQAEHNLNVIRETYRLGNLRLLDVLNEQRRVVEIRQAHIDARAELARSGVELERAVGGSLR